MKRAGLVVCCIWVFIFFLVPLVFMSCEHFGYTLEFANYSVFTMLTAQAIVYITVFVSFAEVPSKDELACVLFALATPFLLLNAVFYVLADGGIWVGLSIFTCFCCCCYLTARYGKPLALKVVSLVLSGVMALPVGILVLFMMIFGNISQDTVVQSVASPEGAYYAEVIDNNQGALGGSTLVDVYENKGVKAFVFRIYKKPQRIYSGRWGEFENMEIYWRDEELLVINGTEYTIK